MWLYILYIFLCTITIVEKYGIDEFKNTEKQMRKINIFIDDDLDFN